MTRGRRKDMTIPPSRGLTQQRDYRARKAQYVADLEVRAKKAEEENIFLRKEVQYLQAKLSRPEVTAAYSDLLHHLTIAASSIRRFQQLSGPVPVRSGPAHMPITLSIPPGTSDRPALTVDSTAGVDGPPSSTSVSPVTRANGDGARFSTSPVGRPNSPSRGNWREVCLVPSSKAETYEEHLYYVAQD
ncbi:transcription factor [Ganoderma sinense ZZ0214-1]|uniref:Transcription factor n=1 Tax=Ganoderma sinense ZZ0214-1 TaxID=1077348 RepID=A0A2G8S692_9APHY|nr:transcription factor [Ganoderma sinense ZZ0214-1]